MKKNEYDEWRQDNDALDVPVCKTLTVPLD